MHMFSFFLVSGWLWWPSCVPEIWSLDLGWYRLLGQWHVLYIHAWSVRSGHSTFLLDWSDHCLQLKPLQLLWLDSILNIFLMNKDHNNAYHQLFTDLTSKTSRFSWKKYIQHAYTEDIDWHCISLKRVGSYHKHRPIS